MKVRSCSTLLVRKYFPPDLAAFLKEISFSIQDGLIQAEYFLQKFNVREAAVSKAKLVVVGLLFCVVVVMANERSPLKLVNSVDLPKYSGDFDHFAADVQGNRLFLAAEDHGTLEVFDLKSTKWLQTVKGRVSAWSQSGHRKWTSSPRRHASQ